MSVPLPYTPKIQPVVEYIPYDGLKFKTVFYEHPKDTEFKGRLVWVHGFSEDSLIYTEFLDKLAGLGFDVFFFDQRGAGETSPGSGEGRSNEEHTFKDLDFMIKKNLEANPYKNDAKFNRLLLGGHSMGGGIVLNYGIRGKYKENIKGIIATGPLIEVHPSTAPNAALKLLANISYKLMPNFRLDAGLNYDYITSNEKWVDYIKKSKDKFWMSSALFHDMSARGEALLKPEYVAKFDPNISLLIFHGTDDHINYFNSTEKFYKLLNDNVDKEFVPIKDARHSLLIETDDILELILNKIVAFSQKL